MKRLLCVLILVSLAFAPKAKQGGGNALPVLSLDAHAWTTIAAQTTVQLSNEADGSLAFDFPVGEDFGPSINYLYSPMRKGSNLSAYSMLQVALTVVTTGAPVFHFKFEDYNLGNVPANTRPFIWANRNSFNDGSRWWAIDPAKYTLAEGSTTIIVQLTPDQWSGVNGERADSSAQALQWWGAALQNVSSLGLTFGGGSFFGHGVNQSGGTAKFVLTNVQVQ
jgi:hypothetical protein